MDPPDFNLNLASIAGDDQEHKAQQLLFEKLKTNIETIENYKKWQVKCPSKISGSNNLAIENDILKGQILRREQMIKVLRRFIYTHMIEQFQNNLLNIPIYNATKVGDFINYEDSLVVKLRDDIVNLELKYQNALHDLQQMQFRNNLEKQGKAKVINEFHSTELNFMDNIKRLEGEKRNLNVLLKLRNKSIEEERENNNRLNEELDYLRHQYEEQVEVTNRLQNELVSKEVHIDELNRTIDHSKSFRPPPEIKIIEKIKEPTRDQVDKHFLHKYDGLVKELDNLVKEGVFFENDYDKIHGMYSKYTTTISNAEVEAKLRDEVVSLNNNMQSCEEKLAVLQEKYDEVTNKVLSLTTSLDEKNEYINTIEGRLDTLTSENKAYQEEIIEIKKHLGALNSQVADEIEQIIRKKKDKEVQTNSTIDCSMYHDSSYEVKAVKISVPKQYNTQITQTNNPRMKSSDTQTYDNNAKSFADNSCQTNESDQELPIEPSILTLLESLKKLVKYTLPSNIYFQLKTVEPQEFMYAPSTASSQNNVEEDYQVFIHKKILTKVIKIDEFLPGNEQAVLRLKKALSYVRDLTYLRNEYVVKICQNPAFSTSNTRQLIRFVDLVIQSMSYLLLPESYQPTENETDEHIRQYILSNNLSSAEQDNLDFIELSRLFSNSNLLNNETIQPVQFDSIGAHRGIISGKYMNRSDSPRNVRPNTSGALKAQNNPVKIEESVDNNDSTNRDYYEEYKFYETGDVSHLKWSTPLKVASPTNEKPPSNSPSTARKTVVNDHIMQELLLTRVLNSPGSPSDRVVFDQRRALTATPRNRSNRTKKLSFENPNPTLMRPQRPFSSDASLDCSDTYGFASQRVNLKTELSKREKVTGAKLAFL